MGEDFGVGGLEELRGFWVGMLFGRRKLGIEVINQGEK
jgi:hypothetical protein